MGERSAIEWTDHTFNPWWGCIRVSPGCEHCYAETFAKRVGQRVWGPAKTTERRLFGEAHWREPVKWNALAEKAGVRARVFCASMADVFEDHPALPAERAKLWPLIEATPWLDWQILTKRPENVERMVPREWLGGFPDNVWLGTSVEDQVRADERIPALVEHRDRAAVLFLSCEPLLGPVALGRLVKLLDWVIVGGESGPGARDCYIAWIDAIRDQCQSTALFIKQLGRHPIVYDGGTSRNVRLNDAKGGDWTEWPEDLRIREMPARGAAQPEATDKVEGAPTESTRHSMPATEVST